MTSPLCDQLGALLERTYDIEPSVLPLGRFVVGDEGLRRLLAQRTVRERVDHDGAGARLLLRDLDDHAGWAATLYLPDALIAHLEQHDPRRGLDDRNVDAFATLIEEVDHLVTFHDRVCHHGGELSLFELEWHALVSQYLVLGYFLARLRGQPQLDPTQRAFLEHHLFDKRDYSSPDPAVRERYRHALRLGHRLVRRLAGLDPSERLRQLRRFHRASHAEKLRSFAA